MMSKAFQTFLQETPQHAKAWGRMVEELGTACALDEKAKALAYLAVLAALRLPNGIPFHVILARKAGATREEIFSAVLIGLPAAGHGITEVLPAVLEACEKPLG